MNFVFASSHLPEDNRPQEDEEEEDVQPMQRSGMVRAFSHLPQPVQGEPAAPRPFGPSAPTHLPSWATEPPETEHEPEAETDAGSHGDFEPPATAGSFNNGAIGPSSPHGAAPPAGRSLFLTPRPMPPEYARQQATTHGAGPYNRGNGSSLGSPPQLAARADALAQAGGQQPGQGPVQPSDTKETPKQPSPAAPAPSPANAAPQQPGQSAETPENDLKEYLKKSRNPFFVKNSYDEKTPLEEKLRLRQLLLSLKAPPGEKLPFFIAHLQHWLNAKNRPPAGEEKPMEYALNDFMQFPVVPEALKKAQDYFGYKTDSHLGDRTFFDWVRAHPDAAKPGGVDVPDTYFETVAEGGKWGYPKPNNEAFYYGFGGAPLTVRSSGIKGFVDKNGAVTFRGTFNPELNDRYDWNKGQGTPLKLSPKIPMEMIRKYIPKDIPVISPRGDEISVGDSFFKDLQEQGYGRDFNIRAPGKPMRLEYFQPKPGAPFTTRVIPASP